MGTDNTNCMSRDSDMEWVRVKQAVDDPISFLAEGRSQRQLRGEILPVLSMETQRYSRGGA